MPSPTFSLGRLTMREDWQVSETGDGALSVSGQESIPRLSALGLAAQQTDFLSLAGQMLPVIFSTKTYLNGFYSVNDVSGDLTDWGSGIRTFSWKCELSLLGNESNTDIESRLGGALTRVNDFTVTGERTHAPAITHGGYWTDGTVSAAVSRVGEDGTFKLYKGIGQSISPRWATTAPGYLTGRVRLLDDTSRERAGDGALLNPTSWTLTNGLVRVRPLASGGVLEVAAYTGGSWKTKNWDILADATTLGTFDRCMVINNQFELVTIRLMKFITIGRRYVDITLRRGHRIAEIYIQSEFGATLKIVRASTEAGSNALGGTVVATSLDGDNNKYIVGSARTFVPDTVNGGISKAATPTLDAFVGVVVGSSPVTGDAAVDLQKQYIGLPTELVQGVRR